ncbi:MAG: hypothetical protein RLW62_20085 [Gammaproteobacteria bacterium]
MNGFDGPIHVVVGNPRRRVVLAVLAHGAAALVVLALLPLTLTTLLGAAAIALNGVLVCRRLASRADAVHAVLLDAADRWQVTLVDGRVLDAEQVGAAFVSVPLTALTLRASDGCRRHVVLLGDGATASRRRLRVRLRQARAGAT